MVDLHITLGSHERAKRMVMLWLQCDSEKAPSRLARVKEALNAYGAKHLKDLAPEHVYPFLGRLQLPTNIWRATSGDNRPENRTPARRPRARRV